MAYLSIDIVAPIFDDENLFDLGDNQFSHRQMLGLEAHTPFECIGQVSEVRLAFELVKRKGLHGKALNVYIADIPPQDFNRIIENFGHVVDEDSLLPSKVAERILPLMQHGAKAARDQLTATLLTH